VRTMLHSAKPRWLTTACTLLFGLAGVVLLPKCNLTGWGGDSPPFVVLSGSVEQAVPQSVSPGQTTQIGGTFIFQPIEIPQDPLRPWLFTGSIMGGGQPLPSTVTLSATVTRQCNPININIQLPPITFQVDPDGQFQTVPLVIPPVAACPNSPQPGPKDPIRLNQGDRVLFFVQPQEHGLSQGETIGLSVRRGAPRLRRDN